MKPKSPSKRMLLEAAQQRYFRDRKAECYVEEDGEHIVLGDRHHGNLARYRWHVTSTGQIRLIEVEH